jgi:outer membrane lipoprotein carrier protein
VKRYSFLLGFVAFGLLGADPSLQSTLKAVEDRYNRAKTLEVAFREEYTPPGRPRRIEAGVLALRKPGRMRWDYTQPKGKLFVSDGKFLWLWVPSENRAEKMKLQASDDMRAPLAFLLGKLKFDKEFRNLQATPEGAGLRIVAEPKSESLPYSRVEFLVTAERRIGQVKVTGFDRSVLDFAFSNEKMNPALDDKRFQFQVPAGARLVEAAQ